MAAAEATEGGGGGREDSMVVRAGVSLMVVGYLARLITGAANRAVEIELSACLFSITTFRFYWDVSSVVIPHQMTVLHEARSSKVVFLGHFSLGSSDSL